MLYNDHGIITSQEQLVEELIKVLNCDEELAYTHIKIIGNNMKQQSITSFDDMCEIYLDLERLTSEENNSHLRFAKDMSHRYSTAYFYAIIDIYKILKSETPRDSFINFLNDLDKRITVLEEKLNKKSNANDPNEIAKNIIKALKNVGLEENTGVLQKGEEVRCGKGEHKSLF